MVRDDRNILKELWLVQIVAALLQIIISFIAVAMIPMSFGLYNFFDSGFGFPHFSSAYLILSGVSRLIGLASIIYEIVYIYKVVEDVNVVCAKTEGGYPEDSWNYVIVILLTLVTCGAYFLYWIYKQGGRLHKALKAYGIESEETGVAYSLWNTVGLIAFGLGRQVSWYLLIQNLNKGARAYNQNKPLTGFNNQPMNGGYAQPPQMAYSQGMPAFAPQQANNGSRTVKQPQAQVQERTMKAAILVGMQGEYMGQQIPLSDKDVIVMGRDGNQANLIFRSEKVSKLHCKIQFSSVDNCYYLTDYSTYGVFNADTNQRLQSGVQNRVNRGTRIKLGDSEVFQLK